MVLRAAVFALLFLAVRPAAAGEPGSGLYAKDCTAPDAGFAVEIAADGTAEVTAGGEAYRDLLTSYSFFGVRTPPDFQIAVLFDRKRAPVPRKDGGPGWLEKTFSKTYYKIKYKKHKVRTSLNECSMISEIKYHFGPILDHKIFFWRFQLYWMLDINSSCNLVQCHTKLMNQT